MRVPFSPLSPLVVGAAALTAVDELGVCFWAKDTERRFVQCSRAFVTLMGYGSADQLLGLRDEDLSPDYLVAHYRHYDESVLRTGECVVDLIEVVREPTGGYGLHVTSKWPLRDGQPIVGVAGITRPLDISLHTEKERFPLAPAVKLISHSYAQAICVADMAAASAMSVAHFSRKFRLHFGTTPHRYLRRVRIMVACDLLSTTDLPVSTVAARTGHYDQSHLCNEFVNAVGMTPTAYRRRYQPRASSPATPGTAEPSND